MSYIERKKVKGHYYLYRYESYRDEQGRPRKRLLQYLGAEADILKLADELRKRGCKNGSK